MSAVKRIAKNTFVQFFSNVAVLLLSLLYAMYTARYLGDMGYGTISFALAFSGIFGVLTDLGLSQLAVRDIARDKRSAEKYLVNLVAIKSILVALTFLFLAIVVNLMGNARDEVEIVYIIFLSVGAAAFTGIFNSAFQAFEKMEYISLGNILNAALMLSGAFLAMSQGYGVIGFAFVYLFANVVTLVYSASIFVLKFFRPRLKPDMSFWGPVLREALPFGITGIFITIYYWTDSVMLHYMKGDEVVGWYNASYRLMIVLLFLPQILNMAIFPAMSQLYLNSKDMLRFAQERSFKYMALVGIPIGVGTTILADKIILLIFGQEYVNSAPALQILVWSSVFIYLSSSYNSLLRSSERQVALTKITAFCAAENIVLNLFAIPMYSYIGASMTTTLTEFTVLVLSAIVASNAGYGQFRRLWPFTSKIILASIVMGIFVMYFHHLNLFLLIPSAAVLYFLVAYSISVFDEDDISIFRKVLKFRG